MRVKFFIWFVLVPQFMWSQQVIEKEITDWEFRMVGDSVWKPAKVPGTIIDNFVDLSDISNPLHPYYGDNEKLYQWIGEKDWEFRTTINMDPDIFGLGYCYDIEFGCLDLFAEVYLNKEEQWNVQNAFIPFRFEGITEPKLDIIVVFHSTSKAVTLMMQHDSLRYPGGERIYCRTAQYQFGWDWGPKFINMGIRKPVKLKIHPPNDVHFSAFVSNLEMKKDYASFLLNFNIESKFKDFRMYYTLLLNDDIVEQHDLLLSIPENKNEDFRYWLIKEPLQWWPNGIGDPNYYTFNLRLTLPEDTHTVAKTSFNLTFCDIKLVQEKNKKGESFYFTVNGEKVYAKGANYVPDDSFHPGKNTKELIKLVRDANMNMIRVWGGGTYPDDDFYEECLKNGIMIWQDYMFACAMYPTFPEFDISVDAESDYQIQRIGSYKNIAVWCGNNENEEGWKNWGWQRDLKISPNDSSQMWNGYVNLFHNELKNALNDTLAAYISTSPKHGWGREESMTEGDSHYWGVWWGLEPLEKYNEKVPRFMSEFGMQGMPDLSTLKKVIPDSAMNFNSPKFKNHQKHPTGFKTLDHYLKEYLVIPDNIEDYAYATQVLQAYALRIAIEAQRRAMPYCMGSLIWQLNDCWPVTSWSLIDSELKTKIAYDEVKKSFEPVMLSVKETESGFDIYVVNDMLENVQDQTLYIKIKDFHSKIEYSKKIKLQVQKQTSKKCFTINKKILRNIDLTKVYLEMSIEDRMPYSYFYFVKPNQLKLLPAEFLIQDMGKGNYKISTDVFAPFVYMDGTTLNGIVLDKDKGAIFRVLPEENDFIPYPSKVKCLNNLILQ